MAITQTAGEFPTQLTFPLDIQGLVYNLVAELHSWLFRELYLEPDRLEIVGYPLGQWQVAQLLGLGPQRSLTRAQARSGSRLFLR